MILCLLSKLCENNAIGTESHILMECSNSTLVKLRTECLNHVYGKSTQLEYLYNQKLYYFMQAIEHEIIMYFEIYMDKILKQLKK